MRHNGLEVLCWEWGYCSERQMNGLRDMLQLWACSNFNLCFWGSFSACLIVLDDSCLCSVFSEFYNPGHWPFQLIPVWVIFDQLVHWFHIFIVFDSVNCDCVLDFWIILKAFLGSHRLFRSVTFIQEEIWSVHSCSSLYQTLCFQPSAGLICRIYLCSNILPLTW